MVAQITIPKSMRRALNYNEKKVQKKEAELIHAQNFLKLPGEMNFHEKLERFERQIELNDRATTKTIHISLNFPPQEKERMSKDFLIQLSDEYMEKMGFGNQPYLVYQHNDAGHPHVHIVSTLIRDDGTRINTHHLGKDVSEPVRKQMEIDHGLISSNKKAWEKEQDSGRIFNAQKVQYGKSETLRSITNVLDVVIDQYKHTSLHELNAVLRQYNVQADRGKEDGRIYKNRGLTYRILDEAGNKTGVPIKASSIYSRPTLKRLEEKMEENKQKREPDKKRLRTMIDWSMQKQPGSLQQLAKELENERITMVIRRSQDDRVYGITYIDHERKSVFNGGDLGKDYAAKRMLERLGMEQQQAPSKVVQKEAAPQQESGTAMKKEPDTSFANNSKKASIQSHDLEDLGKGIAKLIEQVIEPDDLHTSINRELTEEEKRKKRRQQQQER